MHEDSQSGLMYVDYMTQQVMAQTDTLFHHYFRIDSMTIKTSSLLDTLDQLKDSIERADWLQAGRLDEQIKSNLELAIDTAKDQGEREALIGMLTHVQAVYQLLLENTEEAKKQISLELKKITLDKKASDLYRNATKYK